MKLRTFVPVLLLMAVPLAFAKLPPLTPDAQAKADRKGKLNDKINQLDSRIQAKLQKARDRRDAAEREAQAKADALRAKAAAAKATVS